MLKFKQTLIHGNLKFLKEIALFFFLALAILQIKAQDYFIGFAGTGASTTVDSVQVKNLTQNTKVSLNGTDILHLMGVAGIDPGVEQRAADLRISPNPMNEQSFVEFETASSGIATIELCDVAGKKAAQTQNILPFGICDFFYYVG